MQISILFVNYIIMNIDHLKCNNTICFITIILTTSLIIFLTSVESPVFSLSKRRMSQRNTEWFFFFFWKLPKYREAEPETISLHLQTCLRYNVAVSSSRTNAKRMDTEMKYIHFCMWQEKASIFAICSSPLEISFLLFPVDCSRLPFTKFCQYISVYRCWACANPKSKEKQNISDESQSGLLDIQYLHVWEFETC